MDEMSKGMSQTGSTAATDKSLENDGKYSVYILLHQVLKISQILYGPLTLV